MKRTHLVTIALAGLFAAACADAVPPSAPLQPAHVAPMAEVSGGDALPGHYVVVVHPGADPDRVASGAGIRARFLYHVALNGFAGEASADQLETLRRDEHVVLIEPDQRYHADTTQTMDSSGQPWGLDRIDQRTLPLSHTYSWNHAGTGVRAYVIDTGIQTSHPDFGGRAAVAYDALGGSGQDCNGHGTHVAGTIAGKTYGVAKNARPMAVRVLDCSGSGTTSTILAGIDWVQTHALKPAVANISLGGGYSSTINNAVNSLASAGVFVAVAAGNNNANACNYSPSSASAAFTTAASTRTDAKASYSNWGSCVDAYAPGDQIKSDWINSGTATASGTSMAAPHVAGVAALYKSAFGDAATSTVTTWILSNATTGVITGNPSGTPNRLLYKASL